MGDKGVTTSHWPHEYNAMNTHGSHPKFRLNSEMQELVCPEKIWRTRSDAKARVPGCISILEEVSFVVVGESGYLPGCNHDGRSGVPVRSLPSDDLGDEIGRLP